MFVAKLMNDEQYLRDKLELFDKEIKDHKQFHSICQLRLTLQRNTSSMADEHCLTIFHMHLI
jgi:hypothetical protein